MEQAHNRPLDGNREPFFISDWNNTSEEVELPWRFLFESSNQPQNSLSEYRYNSTIKAERTEIVGCLNDVYGTNIKEPPVICDNATSALSLLLHTLKKDNSV
ncbi:MAG: hypothetical protein RRB13_06050, partial [bacterium]|nr:hypothetical protein [bacterium]